MGRNINNGFEFDRIASALSDGKLTDLERKKLNEFLEVKNDSKEKISNLKSEVELKKLLEESYIYKEALKETENFSEKEIITIQRILGSSEDGKFGIETLIDYRASDLKDNFTLTEIAKGREVGKNIKGFLENFSKTKGFDKELLNVLMKDKLKPNSFVFLDENGNISISEKKNGENILTFSIRPSREFLVYNAFESGNLKYITDYFKKLKKESYKKEFIKLVKDHINKYKFQTEARKLFTKNKNGIFSLNFPDNKLFEEIFTINDLFGDLNELKINGKIYKNNGKGNFVNQKGEILKFSDLKNNKVENGKEIQENNSDIEEVKNTIAETKENAKNLSAEFGKWLNGEGRKFIRGKQNSCGASCSRLINAFARRKGILGGLVINQQRHGANFNNILNNEVSVNNPFVLQGRKGIIKITSKEQLKKYGIDINRTLNKKFKVTKRKIDFPKDAKPGEILTYNGNAVLGSKMRRIYGHVEIKTADNQFASYYKSSNPGGSSKAPQKGDPAIYRKKTGFDGYAYALNLA